MSLITRWIAFSNSSQTSYEVNYSWGALLLALYDAPGRHYHAVRHLEYVLSLFDAHRGRFIDPVQAEIALWFHDAIYAVPSQRNEERSAEMCGAYLAATGMLNIVPMAPSMILATKHADADVHEHADTNLVLDIDLAGFADPWDDFSANNDRIRREFAVYDEATYRASRVAFLRGLLNRGPIFRVLKDLEAPARANIERHIVDLTRTP